MAFAAPSGFDRLVDRFFDDYFLPTYPSGATSAGFHQYDAKLEDYSREGVTRRIARLHEFEREFAGIDGKGLPESSEADRQLVLARIRAELLELEQIRMWERNPDQYSSGITNSAFVIMSRKFAPAEERLRSLIARERRMPGVFQAARTNLKNPPKIYTEVALLQLPGIVSFFEKDVPTAFQDVRDAKLKDEFHTANAAVISALRDYERWLRSDLLPRSQGDFRIGPENYRKKLLYEEMVDTPLDRLLQIGMEDLRKNQETFQEVARKVYPGKTAQQVLAELEKDHPAPDRLLQSFRDVLGGLREFIAQHHIVTIPSPVLPILEETPPFMRALTFASMDTPGAYEVKAQEAFFNVTLPEREWSGQQVEEHMAAFNRGTIISTAIHEAYPGHYVQFLWVQQPNSKPRKLLGAGSNIEGWAHYTEQMMLEEGYGGGDSKLKLGQLLDALLRNARYICGIHMHTGDMTYEQAADFFVKEGYQTKANAEREAKRGTSDPTYLVYTLGKLQIQKLRADYQRRMGNRFQLQEFHDRFLGQGLATNQVIRRALLGDSSPAL